MGAFRASQIELISMVGEVVGFKSGLALTRGELGNLWPHEHGEFLGGSETSDLRVRSEEYAQIVAHILYKLGNVRSSSIMFPSPHLHREYRKNKKDLAIYQQALGDLPAFMESGMAEAERQGARVVNPGPYLLNAFKKNGRRGAEIAEEILLDLNDTLHRDWSQTRRTEWSDVTQLKELFDSESLETQYGSFIDQRFVDYLDRNFDDIDKVNWRKFEGLAGEFFERHGYHVELGSGRNDGSIDARIWPDREERDKPPALLVQCKRTKTKVGKVVVKALWADIVDEKATSGLIVTTSAISPGAQQVATARGYPILEANRKTLADWLRALRTPDSGVFMGR